MFTRGLSGLRLAGAATCGLLPVAPDLRVIAGLGIAVVVGLLVVVGLCSWILSWAAEHEARQQQVF